MTSDWTKKDYRCKRCGGTIRLSGRLEGEVLGVCQEPSCQRTPPRLREPKHLEVVE